MARSRSRKKSAAKVSRRPRKQRAAEVPIFIKPRLAKLPPGKPSASKPSPSKAKVSRGKPAGGKPAQDKSSPGKSSPDKPFRGKFSPAKFSSAKPASAKSKPAKPPAGKPPAGAASANAAEASLVAYAHDIRTALTGILALSELLATSTTGERERRWALGIKGSAEHLSGLTTLMIDAAQAEGGALKLQEDVFDLRSLVAAVANSLSARAETKDLVTEVAVAADLPENVRGDVVRLRAALENLIDNAVKFTERGKVRLEIGVEPAKRGRTTVVFSLSDTGIGLKPAEIHRLFHPFTQANADIARRYGGTGLGLVVVKALAKRMGGDLTVTSTYGEGSTFQFAVQVGIAAATAEPKSEATKSEVAESKIAKPAFAEPAITKSDVARSDVARSDVAKSDPTKSDLPKSRIAKSKLTKSGAAKPAKSAVAEPRPEEPPPRPRLSVLCVEDNPYGRVILNTILAELGHRADFASSGEGAIDAVTRGYDAVLMDMTLPGIDGLEATRRIRAFAEPTGQIPIIGISGRSDAGDEAAAKAAGMNAYLRKPLSPKMLNDVLAAVVPKPA
jgi:two-component system, sensor histidine kinase